MYRRQLELIYQDAAKASAQRGEVSTPRREILVQLRDYCGDMVNDTQAHLASLEKRKTAELVTEFPCPACPSVFRYKGALTSHIKKAHPDVMADRIEAKIRATLSKGWATFKIPLEKFRYFVSVEWFEQAFEQLRVWYSQMLKDYENAAKNPLKAEIAKQNGPEKIKWMVMITARGCFQEHYRGREIPQKILDKLDSLVKTMEM